MKRRGFGENLGYYTGSGYLGGAVVGGGLGFARAAAAPQPAGAQQSRRLLINRLLNSSGQTGRLAGARCLSALLGARLVTVPLLHLASAHPAAAVCWWRFNIGQVQLVAPGLP